MTALEMSKVSFKIFASILLIGEDLLETNSDMLKLQGSILIRP